FMNDPIGFFDRSITKMHQIPRDELEMLQREAMARRFAEHRESISMVRKLADRLGVKEVREFADILPLFFAHPAFKSYPRWLPGNSACCAPFSARPPVSSRIRGPCATRSGST